MNEQYLEKAAAKRNEWAKSDALRDAGIKEPEHVKKVTDIIYAESRTEDETKWHLMDIYYPEENKRFVKNGRYPVIVSVHGGGWFYGDKELYRLYTMTLATYGFAVVNFNYRLSPEHQYPAGFMDVCGVMDYLNERAGEYSLDMERIYMVGDSAGAQLVSQYCIYATNPCYRELFGRCRDMKVIVPQKIALNCGIYDVGSMITQDEMCDWYVPSFIQKNIAISFFNILDYMTKDFPETYLMISVNDPIAKHSLPLKQKLEQLSVPFIYREFGQGEPEDGHVFHMNMRSENGKRANQEEMEFFASCTNLMRRPVIRNRSIAVVVRDDKILSVQTYRAGGYINELPGGGIENGESPEEAAMRELKEECGLDGTINRQLNVLHRKDGSTEYVFLVDVNCKQKEIVGIDPEIPQGEEQPIKNVRWLKLNEFSERERAFIWSYGLLDVDGFFDIVAGWGNEISYPINQ